MTEPDHVYVDVSLLDKVLRARRCIDDVGNTAEQTAHDELPEELMSELDNHIGDALARITVSGALSSNHEFHKAESFVSITVACNNDLSDVEQVHDIVRPYVQELVHKDHAEMSLLRDTILPDHKRLHGNEKEDAVPEKVSHPPKKSPQSKVVARKGAKSKPSFRR